jgi:hypothetical protein
MQFIFEQKVAVNTNENFPAPEFGALDNKAPKLNAAEQSASPNQFCASPFKVNEAPIFMPKSSILTEQNTNIAA